MHLIRNQNKILFHLILLIIFCSSTARAGVKMVNYDIAGEPERSQLSWIYNLQKLGKDIKECVKTPTNTTLSCFKVTSLRMLDGILSSKEIPLCSGVRFVRIDNVAPSVNDDTTSQRSNIEGKALQHITWFKRLEMRLAETLSTHYLQISLEQVANAYESSLNQKAALSPGSNSTARFRRHHRNNMIMTMMLGVTAFGAVIVPMGFQLLSVVSGKALLLAKMALLLASINGLKRVANSGVHYGLYHVPGEPYSYYDRGDAGMQHPRHVPRLEVAHPGEF